MQAKRGFTLVEILIVVVILGILAAIVIPQFTQASTEAKGNSLASDLQSLRSQIELYKVQHNDVPPGQVNGTFTEQMIWATDINGNRAGTPSKVRDPLNKIDYGPYLERVPINPFNDEKDSTYDPAIHGSIASVTTKPAGADGTTSWVYNSSTGEIWANNTGATPQGVNYFDF
jgi:general secretion pathway protein G